MKVYTQDEYAKTVEILTHHNLNSPAPLKILQNLKGVCEMIESGYTYQDIITKYDIGICSTSFSTIFKEATGLSVTQVRLVTRDDKLRARLIKSGMTEAQANEILKV